ncbi:MAG: hypothetical protein RL462_573 [Pseudomonadota bacterium]|jgi:hypothetical protein
MLWETLGFKRIGDRQLLAGFDAQVLELVSIQVYLKPTLSSICCTLI